jgi:hypothetical protein
MYPVTVGPAAYNREFPINASKHFEVMPTIDIINKAKEYGYMVSSYSQKRVRDSLRAPFTKHMVRLRMDGIVPVVGDVVPEILVVNAHDRTTRLQFMLGFFRFVCANGMVTGDIFEDYRFKHTDKNPFEKILEQFDSIRVVATERLDSIREMQDHQLSYARQRDFAFDASKLIPERVYYETSELNNVVRETDRGNSLWLTFNRVQENLIRGLAHIRSANGKVRKSRPINSIDTNISVNQRLWKIAESYLPSANSDRLLIAA